MKKQLLTKTLLMAVMLLGGANFASGATKTIYPTGATDPTDPSVWTLGYVTGTQNSTDNYISLTHSGNGCRNVYLKFFNTGYDFYSDYDSYTVSFDFWNNNAWSNSYSSIAEIMFFAEGASFPNPLYNAFTGANTTKKNYLLGLEGSGTWINSFKLNDSETTVTFTKQTWYTASITVTNTGSVTYSICPRGSSTPITNGSGIYAATADGTSYKCQGILLTMGRGCYETRVANVKVTAEIDYGKEYTKDKTVYDTKVASLDAAGQSYWTANVTSSASVTDEASYNTAVAALPTTYIAAVKAQTTAGSDMTDAMPTGNAGWTCSQGNGPASYLSTGATETYSNGSTYAKFAAGNIMTQSISDLPNGYYRVKFYGVVNAANNVSTVSGSDLVQAYANSATLDIDVIKQNSCTPTDYLRSIEVQVTDGTLTYGLKAKDGVTDAGNWAVAKTYSLTYLGSTLYDYTINYKFNDATISSVDGSAAFGETINATSPITISDTKYYATSTTSMVIGEEPNVLNVTLREAENWRYTVRAVNSTAGVINDNLASGSVIEGEVGPKVFFPRYVLKGTTLYCNNTGTVAYSATVTPNANDYVYDVNYNQTPVNNVAFYIEAENVTGVTKGTNADRASMGKMGHTGGADTYKDVTTLTPGKYILYSRFQNGNDAARTYNFKVGGVVVHTGSASKGTNNDTYSSEFTVNTPSVLSFASGGSDNGGVDYFYLVKTADFATIGAKNYTTFASAYPLDCSDLPDGLTAYYVEAEKIDKSNSVVKLTAATEAVAAGTGLLLKGDANEDYYIPVAATSGTDLSSTNKMIGCTTATTLTSTTPNVSNFYVLVNGATAPEFQNIATYVASNNVTIPAGKAYLDATGVETSRLSIVFDDNETTGIRLTENSELRTENAVYDLQGRRVMNAQKGLYIVNGKKVVIK